MEWYTPKTTDHFVETHNQEQQAHIYSDLGKSQIRLIELYEAEEISCSLHVAKLEDKPKYTALSYCWGVTMSSKQIYLEGRRYAVTTNLYRALRELRRHKKTNYIWIDALCINQGNTEERNHQVQLMRDIFQSATETIIYLGKVLDYGLNDKVSRIRHPFPILRQFATSSADRSQDVQQNAWPSERDPFEPIRHLLRCDWFVRIWTVQEAVVPPTLAVIYGSSYAPWDMLVDAARTFERKEDSLLSGIPAGDMRILAWFSHTILSIENMREGWQRQGGADLLSLLRQFSGRRATDDRDKIYALLGLAEDRAAITPDYSRDAKTVFEQSTLDIIGSSESLGVLPGDIGWKDREALPSWVPDWCATYDTIERNRASWCRQYNASAGTTISVQRKGADRWAVLRGHLHKMLKERTAAGEPNEAGDTPLTWDRKRCKEALETSEWEQFVPNFRNFEASATEYNCLPAVDEFLALQKRWYRLHELGLGILKMPAYIFDTVITVGQVILSEVEVFATIRSWAELVSKHAENLRRCTANSEGLGTAFMRTVCADVTCIGGKRDEAPVHRILKQDFCALTTRLFFVPDAPLSPNHTKYGAQARDTFLDVFSDIERPWTALEDVTVREIDNAIRTATHRRKFFITEGGRMGLGPSVTREGDQVCIFPGGYTPYLLRDSESRETIARIRIPLLSQFQNYMFNLIGDCYVHGCMDGEAMAKWSEKMEEQQKFMEKPHTQRFTNDLESWISNVQDLEYWQEKSSVMKIAVKHHFHQLDRSRHQYLRATEEGLLASLPDINLKKAIKVAERLLADLSIDRRSPIDFDTREAKFHEGVEQLLEYMGHAKLKDGGNIINTSNCIPTAEPGARATSAPVGFIRELCERRSKALKTVIRTLESSGLESVDERALSSSECIILEIEKEARFFDRISEGVKLSLEKLDEDTRNNAVWIHMQPARFFPHVYLG